MNRFPIKINKSEIQKIDNKIEFFNDVIESSITTRCDNLYKEAHFFCGKECKRCFEICNDIIKLNPDYIQAYLKKISCKKRIDKTVQLYECDELLIKFPKYSTKVFFLKLRIIRQIKNRIEELNILAHYAYEAKDNGITNNYSEIKHQLDELNEHNNTKELIILLNKLTKITDLGFENSNDDLTFGFGELDLYYKLIEYNFTYFSENLWEHFVFINRKLQFEERYRNKSAYLIAINDFKKSVELIESSNKSVNKKSLYRSIRNLFRIEVELTDKYDDLPF